MEIKLAQRELKPDMFSMLSGSLSGIEREETRAFLKVKSKDIISEIENLIEEEFSKGNFENDFVGDEGHFTYCDFYIESDDMISFADQYGIEYSISIILQGRWFVGLGFDSATELELRAYDQADEEATIELDITKEKLLEQIEKRLKTNY